MTGVRPEQNDAFGREIWTYLNGGDPYEIVERDDGFISAAGSTGGYFATFSDWPRRQRQAMRFLRGSTALDVGCGAGRVALYLQERGLRVTAIDNSPLAIRTARKRGVKGARLFSFGELRLLAPRKFDSVVMFGNNFGLFGSYRNAKKLLGQLRPITGDRAVVLAESLNPYKTDDRAHLEYQRRNRSRGRMSGQIRIRIRFRDCLGPWFDYLLVSPAEMKDILKDTGWNMRRTIDDGGPSYVAVIEKT
jgi:SAM-dependent methyltransferase